MTERKIKFRAWDKLNGMVYDPAYSVFSDSREFRLNDILKQTQPILMQFTGLKDKNGKEIYEGDICNYSQKTPLGWVPHKGVMDFDEGAFKIKAEVDEIWNFDSEAKDIEVVGNIYENPDLTKIEKNE